MSTDKLAYEILPVAALPGHEERAWHVAWNPTRPLLASCSADKSVRLYAYQPSTSESQSPDASHDKINDLKFSHLTTIPTGHAKTVRALAWAPSGKTLATASFDANIGVWEQEADEEPDSSGVGSSGDWECVSLLEGHETECKSVSYSASGTLLASCSRDKTVWIWEVHPDADFECMGVLMEHTQDVKCVAWHPIEEILASASYDDTIKLYMDDPSDDWFCASTLTGHTSTVWALAWAPGGTYLASASDDKTVRIWRVSKDGSAGECVGTLAGHQRSVYSVTWGRGKGKEGSLGWLATSGGDGVIRVWEIEEPEEGPSTARNPLKRTQIAQVNDAHGVCDVNTVAWCPREGYEDLLASAGDDGAVRVWRVHPSTL